MTINSFTIRSATNEDEPFLWEMLYESIYIPEGNEKPSRDIINHPSISKYLEGWGKDGDIGFIVVDSNNKPIGSITCRLFDENNKGYGYIDENTPELGMAVVYEHRGKGIGTQLLKSMLQEVKSRGFKNISLSVDPNNAAIRLYKKFGFIEVGIEGTSVTLKKEL